LKAFRFLIIICLFFSCRKAESIQELQTKEPEKNIGELSFVPIENVRDKKIRSDSSYKVEILYNGMDNFLGGKKNPKVNFQSEWLPEEQVQVIEEGLLFANRILIAKDKVHYLKNDVVRKSKNLPLLSDNRERMNPERDFSNCQVKIKYQGISCNDADFNNVKIQYKNGDVEIDSILNAVFFEHDLDLNGNPEQYVMGSRNCSQELVLLRITEKPSR